MRAAWRPRHRRTKNRQHCCCVSCCCSACAGAYLLVKAIKRWRRGYHAALAAAAKRTARAAEAAQGAAAAEGSQPGSGLAPGHAAALKSAQRVADAAQEAAATGGCKAQLQQLCHHACCEPPTAACVRQVPHDDGDCSKCDASHLQIFTPEELASTHMVTACQWTRVEVSQPGGAATQPDGLAADAAGSSRKKPTKRVKLELLELTAADLSSW